MSSVSFQEKAIELMPMPQPAGIEKVKKSFVIYKGNSTQETQRNYFRNLSEWGKLSSDFAFERAGSFRKAAQSLPQVSPIKSQADAFCHSLTEIEEQLEKEKTDVSALSVKLQNAVKAYVIFLNATRLN